MKILFALSNGSCPYILEASKKLLKKCKRLAFCYSENCYENTKNLNNFIIRNKIKIFVYNNSNDDLIKIDKKYLNYIHNNLKLNLWKCVSVDRSLGRGYIQDLDGYKSTYLSKDHILSVAIKK